MIKNQKIILGTAQFGMNYGINNFKGKIAKKEAFKIIDAARKVGIDTFDTAITYGDSENILGEFNAQSSHKLVIISKLPECIPGEVQAYVNASLKKLNLNRIYGYLVHNFKNYRRFPELFNKLCNLKAEGKVSKIGFSLYYPNELEYLLSKNVSFDLIQIPLSIFDQRFLPYLYELKKKKVEVHARSVFLQGLIFKKPEEMKGVFSPLNDKLKQLSVLARDNSISLLNLFLNFVLFQDYVDKVVVGVDSLTNLKELIAVASKQNEAKKRIFNLADYKIEDEQIIVPANWKVQKIKPVNEEMIAIIQARLGSTRLPEKVLLKIKGKTILEHVVQRVKASKLVTKVMVATTDNKEDKRIISLCKRIGVDFFCGSENDVLDRYYQAAKLFKSDNIVRITADCPLIDPDVIDRVIRFHLDSNADYTSNILKETYPDGEDVEVFTFGALEKAWQAAQLKSEREHVTVYIRKNPSSFKLHNVECEVDLSNKRWTLDEKKDYDFIKVIYENLYVGKCIFKMKDILRFLNMRPGVERINSGIIRNEGYRKSLVADGIVNLESQGVLNG